MAEASLRRDVRGFLKDIRLEHSVFALPFALLGLLLATASQVAAGTRGSVLPSVWELGWILVAMVGARSAAMGFNRVVDRRLDALNPRTQRRPLAAGEARLPAYLALIALGVALLFGAAAALNPLCWRLAPLALLIVFGYSLTKHFTVLCHYFVGLSLAVAPVAAWVAITGALPRTPAPYLLALAVLLWVGGFDIIYATMDTDFDRQAGVHSLPAWLGVRRSLQLARASHAAMALALAGVGLSAVGLGVGWWLGLAVTAALLAYEHAIVRPDDLRRVNTAFFTLNGVVGLLLLLAGAADVLRCR